MNQGFEVEWNQKAPIGTSWGVFKGNIVSATINEVHGVGTGNGFIGYDTFSEVGNKVYIATSQKGSYTVFTWATWQSGGLVFPQSNEWQRMSRVSLVRGYDRIASSIVEGSDLYIKDFICIDLTQMFGTGNEPNTAAEFEAWLLENGINPNEYIPYNAGEKRKMTKPSWLL